jgi:aminopeptidase N
MQRYPRLLSSLCLGLALVFPTITLAEQPFSFETTPGQLPKTVVPLNYVLRIQPDLVARTFTGTALIDIEVRQPVTEVVLNALELEIDRAALVDNPANAEQLEVIIDPEKQTLALPIALAVGRHSLEFSYRGKIGLQAQGFFIDKYDTPNGERLMLGTQMESTDARRVFPCWDEPVFRATFDITFIIPENLTGVSNMPVIHEESAGAGFKALTFDRTPSMPSYLVALYAAEFEAVEGEFEGIKLRILTTEGKRDSALYAMEATKRVMRYFYDYFGVKYPLPKLDQIGVPNAFSGFGAMENWGCITYIDTALLYNPATSGQSGKEGAFDVIAHEIAHQWFGNIVTMAWWDNIWLNEGFASWVGTKNTDANNPTWEFWLRANDDKESAMALDARSSSHAILQLIENEAQAANAFDTISYLKGQGVLRMLETYLGEATFRDGIQLYIKRHAYSNTTTADLWQALEETAGKPVTAVANGWIERPGFPIITVSAREENGRRWLDLAQSRFLLAKEDTDSAPWQIPVTLATLSQINHPETLLFDTKAITIPWPRGEGPIKLNVGNTGFYRVQYDDQLGAALQNDFDALPVEDQINLLSDTWALTRAGRVPATLYLELATKLDADAHPVLQQQLLGALSTIDNLEEREPGRHAFQSWASTILRPLLARLGYAERPDESPLDGSLRAKLISDLGTYGDPATLAWAREKFPAYLADEKSISGNLAGPMLDIVGRYADRTTYDELNALVVRSLTTRAKRRAYSAMQASLDPTLIKQTLLLSLSGEMPMAEANSNLERLARKSEDPELVLAYTLSNIDALIKRVTSFEYYGYLPGIMSAFNDEAHANQLMAIMAEKFPADALPVAARTADGIRDRSRFKQRALPSIDAWVGDQLGQNPE